MEQVMSGELTMWPPNRTATRGLSDDFSRTVFGVDMVDLGVSGGANIGILILSGIAPIDREPFDWEAAEQRAGWEQSHGLFAEFTDVKDLLSNLHS